MDWNIDFGIFYKEYTELVVDTLCELGGIQDFDIIGRADI